MARHKGPRTRSRAFLALMGVFALLFMGLVSTGTAQATGGSTISAQALNDHDCDSSEWHFVITQVDEEANAPDSISVQWANGSSEDVSLGNFTGGVAHYTTTSNLDSTVTSATASIYEGWSGQFNLSHGPCQPVDACPSADMPGNQPAGTDCTQPEDDRETRDLPGVVDCQDETYTVEHQERTREYSWDGDSWEPGPWSDWTTYDTTVTPATDEQCPDEPVDANDGLCHATGSESNPYVYIEDISSAGIYNGHFDEDGPGPEAPGDHQNNADIIPPFTYQGETYSQNWDAAGQAIYDAGCKVEDDEEEPEGSLSVTSNCESITFSSSGVKPEGAEQVFKLDGVVMAPGTYPVSPGQHTVELFVDGEKVDSETVTVAECEDGQVTPAGFTLANPTCASDGSLLIPAQPEGVLVTPAPGTYGPGSYDVVFTAADGFDLTTNPSGAVTVLAATGYQDEDESATCYVEREPDVRETSSERENCKLGGVETTHAVYTTSYSFNEATQAWESSETATSSLNFEPYTAAELREKGCVKGPDNNPDNPDNTPVTPTSNTPTTADTGLWTEEPASKNGSALWGMAAALVLMSLGFLGYGARRRGQES